MPANLGDAMRVQYTLAGFLPAAETLPSEAGELAGGPFLSRLKFLPLPRSRNWKSLLHLDEDPLDPTSIGPPPRQGSADFRDAALDRWDWMQMLERLVAAESGAQSDESAKSDGKGDRAIEQMLTMLVNFQQAEDFIAARYLAESGE